jgi:hypothetical protein
MNPYVGLEKDFQKSAAKLFDLHGLIWCHVANERQAAQSKDGKKQRSAAATYKFLAGQGVKSGVPDVLIFSNTQKYTGFALELKVKRPSGSLGKPTKNQKEWLNSLHDLGWYVAVVYNIDELDKIINNYIK